MKGFCLGVAYACSAGGAGSLVGKLHTCLNNNE